MDRTAIRTSEPITPTIYAYTTPEIRRHDGWIKIGYTEQPVDKRLEQQMHTADVEWKLEWKRSAIYDDGTGKPFRDTDFHDYLRKQGIEQQSENRNEWFRISPEESLSLFNDFRVNGGVCKTESVSPYSLRSEQNEAVERAIDYFRLNVEGEFL